MTCDGRDGCDGRGPSPAVTQGEEAPSGSAASAQLPLNPQTGSWGRIAVQCHPARCQSREAGRETLCVPPGPTPRTPPPLPSPRRRLRRGQCTRVTRHRHPEPCPTPGLAPGGARPAGPEQCATPRSRHHREARSSARVPAGPPSPPPPVLPASRRGPGPSPLRGLALCRASRGWNRVGFFRSATGLSTFLVDFCTEMNLP